MTRLFLPAVILLASTLIFAEQRPAKAAPAAYVMQIDMHGPQVVPPVDSGGWGFVRFFFSADRFLADYTVDVKGFSGTLVLGADIRRGPPGSNGQVVHHLADGGFITYGGHMAFTPADLNDMATGLWYVTLYTTLHPNGEMRGQVVLPADFRPAQPAVSDPGPSGQVTVPGVASANDTLANQLGVQSPTNPTVPLPAGPAPALPEAPLRNSVPVAADGPVTAIQPAAPPSVAPAPLPVIISPPNTGDGGLVGVDGRRG